MSNTFQNLQGRLNLLFQNIGSINIPLVYIINNQVWYIRFIFRVILDWCKDHWKSVCCQNPILTIVKLNIYIFFRYKSGKPDSSTTIHESKCSSRTYSTRIQLLHTSRWRNAHSWLLVSSHVYGKYALHILNIINLLFILSLKILFGRSSLHFSFKYLIHALKILSRFWSCYFEEL